MIRGSSEEMHNEILIFFYRPLKAAGKTRFIVKLKSWKSGNTSEQCKV